MMFATLPAAATAVATAVATASPAVTGLVTKVMVFNDDTVSPGLMGSGVVLLLAIAVVFLLRSFRKHVNRVPPTFDPPPDGGPPTGSTGSTEPRERSGS
jgi:hypothetical protein